MVRRILTAAVIAAALFLSAEISLAADLYRPIGEWTGRLILPKPEQREADGSIFFEVANSPYAELIGKVVRLRWDCRKEEDRWFEKLMTDVVFDTKKAQEALQGGTVIPMRLNGWKRVSPLESLAGARPQDDIDVMLKNAVYANGSVYIKDDPVQISGTHVALVQFSGPAAGNLRNVVHYNPASGKFDGASENIYVLASYSIPGKDKLVSSTADVERSVFNRLGWYVYGRHYKGVFVVCALMPRSLHLLEPTHWMQGKLDIKNYYAKLHFKDLGPAMRRSTLIVPEQNADISTNAGIKNYIDACWPEGARGLLVHVFGWRKDTLTGSTGLPGPQWLTAGHFAFGVATVVRDGFTGEKRFDIEYKQIYAHGDGGIVSGTIQWHNYMGDIKRGWMYTIPVSDTIVQIPAMAPYDFNGWRIDPFRGFSRLTEIMMAVYRTGAGKGISSVTPYVSCVQDSHYALYGSLMTFTEAINADPRVGQWMRSLGANHPDAIRYTDLFRLVEDMKNRITLIGLSRRDWKYNFDNPIGTRDPNVAEQIIRTLLSIKTVFPRDGHDNLMFLAADRQYRMWSVLGAMTGGKIGNLWPLPPNSIASH